MVVAAVLTLVYAINLNKQYTRILEFPPLDLLADSRREVESHRDAAEQAQTQEALETQRRNAVGPEENPENGAAVDSVKHEFTHPALWEKQPVVWLANDKLGLGRSEVERLDAERVESSTQGRSLPV